MKKNTIMYKKILVFLITILFFKISIFPTAYMGVKGDFLKQKKLFDVIIFDYQIWC